MGDWRARGAAIAVRSSATTRRAVSSVPAVNGRAAADPGLVR
jgi:hypothetical protein